MARRLLLFAQSETALREFATLLRAFRQDGAWDPVVVVDGSHNDEAAAVIEQDGGTVRRLYAIADRGTSPPVAFAAPSRLAGLKRSALMAPLRVAAGVRACRRQRARARAVLTEIRPDVVVVDGDRVPGVQVALVAEARRVGIPVILVPTAVSSTASCALLRRNRPMHRLDDAGGWVMKSLCRWLLPNQRFDSEGVPLLFFDAEATLAMAIAGILPPHPWVLGGGCDRVAVATAAEATRLQAEGLEAGKLCVTGQPSHDDLYRALCRREVRRGEIESSHGFASGIRLTVVAVPPMLEHAMADWEAHHAGLNSLASSLRRFGGGVLLSLHPRSRRADYADFAATHGFAIADLPLRDVLAVADVFVASALSTTAIWGDLLGIPTVVLAWWGVDANLLEAPLLSINNDDLDLVLAAAAQMPPRSSRLDGLACTRLVDMLAAV